MSWTLFLLSLATLSCVSLMYPFKAPGDSFAPSPTQLRWARILAPLSFLVECVWLAQSSRLDAGWVGWIVSASLGGIVLCFLRPFGAHWTFRVAILCWLGALVLGFWG